MKDKHLGIRIDERLHYKLHHVARYDGRSANGEILYLLRQYIMEFERKHGEIEVALNNEPSKTKSGS